MRISVLAENTALSREFKAVHGICLYIETGDRKILFDLGPRKVFLKNAASLGINITDADTVIISHGHGDHGGGLKAFLEANGRAKIYIHKRAFEKFYTRIGGIPMYIGLDSSLKDNPRIAFTGGVLEIERDLLLFSGVSGMEYFPNTNDALQVKKNGNFVRDDFAHEQNLIICEGDKRVLIGGCAHNGIINIQNTGEEILGKRITHVISGFHLFNPATRETESNGFISGLAAELLKKETIYYTCHCTGVNPYGILKRIMSEKINYISTGQVFEI